MKPEAADEVLLGAADALGDGFANGIVPEAPGGGCACSVRLQTGQLWVACMPSNVDEVHHIHDRMMVRLLSRCCTGNVGVGAGTE